MLKPRIPYSSIICDKIIHWHKLIILAIQLHPTLQSRYQNFLKLHPDGRISRKSFHSMMKECYPGADTEKLERHIFRMYDTNKVNHNPPHKHCRGK